MRYFLVFEDSDDVLTLYLLLFQNSFHQTMKTKYDHNCLELIYILKDFIAKYIYFFHVKKYLVKLFNKLFIHTGFGTRLKVCFYLLLTFK